MSLVQQVSDIENVLSFPQPFFEAIQKRCSKIEATPTLYRFLTDTIIKMKNPESSRFDFEKSLKVLSSFFEDLKITTKQSDNFASLDAAILIIICSADCFDMYKDEQIPRDVFVDTFNDIIIWAKDCFEKTGRWGITEVGWFANHLSMTLFRLGRLQFEVQKLTFPYSIIIPKNEDNEHKISFVVANNFACTKDGFFCNPISELDSNVFFTTQNCIEILSENHKRLIANSVKDGVIESKTTQVNLENYEILDLEKTPHFFYNIHIPAGDPLNIDECIESIKKATQFDYITRNIPKENSPIGFCCTSWLLDPLFTKQLPDKSRIKQFSSLFQVMPPFEVHYEEGIQRVFPSGINKNSICKGQQETSLQKSVSSWLKGGGIFRQGLGIRLI